MIFSQLAYCLCEHGIDVLRRTPNEIPFDRCMFPVYPSQTLRCLFFRVHRYLCRLKHLVAHACIYRVFQKRTPPLKLLYFHFGYIFLHEILLICCVQFVGNSYPHICTNVCRFILIFHQMALIFPRVPIVFTLSSFE